MLMDATAFFKIVILRNKKCLQGELGMVWFQLFENDQLLPLAAASSLHLELLAGETILQLALFLCIMWACGGFLSCSLSRRFAAVAFCVLPSGVHR